MVFLETGSPRNNLSNIRQRPKASVMKPDRLNHAEEGSGNGSDAPVNPLRRTSRRAEDPLCIIPLAAEDGAQIGPQGGKRERSSEERRRPSDIRRPYQKPEDIMKVKGIKEGIYKKIQDRITVQ